MRTLPVPIEIDSGVRARVLTTLLSAVLGTACSDKAKTDYERCESLAAQKKFLEARAACKVAIAKDPNSQSGKRAQAWIPALDLACTDRAKPDYEWCERLEREGRIDAALEACESARKKDPTSENGKLAQTKIPALKARIDAARIADDKVRAALQAQMDRMAECRRNHPNAECDCGCKCQAGDPLCSCIPDPNCDPELPRFHGGGRPFLVDGCARFAPAAERADWNDTEPPILELPGMLPARLADEWTRLGLMEHASIAAFARFTLQLMSLGAPPDLIEGATSAMADETRHAKLCFAIASRYAGRRLGPGALPVERSLSESSLLEIVLNTILEGCVGETIAAIEAGEAAEHASDPTIRGVLSALSCDEATHAALAFRFVKWALTQGDADFRSSVVSAFERLQAEAPLASFLRMIPADRELLQNGVVPESMRDEIRARTIEDLIIPCARALLGEVLPAILDFEGGVEASAVKHVRDRAVVKADAAEESTSQARTEAALERPGALERHRAVPVVEG